MIEENLWECIQDEISVSEKIIALDVYQNELIFICSSSVYFFPLSKIDIIISFLLNDNLEISASSNQETIVTKSKLKDPKTVTVKIQESSYLKDYKNVLFNERLFTDIEFKIGDEVVHAHKAVLVARCNFFYKMFTSIRIAVTYFDLEIGGMKESTDKVIEITDMNLETFNGI